MKIFINEFHINFQTGRKMVTENTELRIQELQEETENVKYRIEILYLLRGEVALKVNQENIILQKDDIHVFNVGDSVEELVLNSGLAARLYFKHSFFSKCCGIENFKIECSSTQNGMDVSGLRKLFHEILVNYFEQKGKDSFLQKELACKIGELLVQKYLVKGAPADSRFSSIFRKTIMERFPLRKLLPGYMFQNHIFPGRLSRRPELTSCSML